MATVTSLDWSLSCGIDVVVMVNVSVLSQGDDNRVIGFRRAVSDW